MNRKDDDIPAVNGITDGTFLNRLCNISRKQLPDGFSGCTDLQEAFSLWIRSNISEDQQHYFFENLSVPALEKAYASGRKSCSFEYTDQNTPNKKHKLTVRFMKDDDTGDLLCVASISDITEQEDTPFRQEPAAITAETVRHAVNAAVADLQVEMELERKEIRKKHRRTVIILSVLLLLAGFAAGALLDQKSTSVSEFIGHFVLNKSDSPETTAELPVPEDPEEVKIETEQAAFGETVTFTAEIMKNGTARTNTSSEDYESIIFTAKVIEVLGPEFFAEEAARLGYEVDGSEAGIHMELSFEDPGEISSVNPQDAFIIRVLDSDGNVLPAYQIVDKPLGGVYGKTLSAGETGNYYKRYDASENAETLLLVYFAEGIQHNLYFALHDEG